MADTLTAVLPTEDKEALVAALGGGPASVWARDAVWLMFIGGMLLILGGLVIALVLKDNPASTITTLATAVITGLFALFAPSPVSTTPGEGA
jgi:hypothetical protein